ncbi:hypothetical protein WA026_009607 [Henosepilachna vigintioctopunctata]|uniref:Palmitoyltransferase n=1 Tax=Henosepilachna vigintioctopunctata TaxID=420089 RepID=A0AAW1U4D4_9CUCU
MPCCKKCYQAIPSILLIIFILLTYYSFTHEFCMKGLKEYPTRQLIYLIVEGIIFFMFAWCFTHVMFCRSNFKIPREFKLNDMEHELLLNLPPLEKSTLLEQHVQKRRISVWLRTPDNVLRYCMRCHLIKPDRSHHCSACDKCVLKMDHHCPWTNNCVGFANHKSFMLMLMYGNLAALFYVIVLIEYYLHIGVIQQDLDTVILCSGFLASCIFLLFSWVLYYQHIIWLLRNVTIIETLQDTHFYNPRLTFDLGKSENFLDVFGECCCFWWIPVNSSYGNGVNFEVRYKR